MRVGIADAPETGVHTSPPITAMMSELIGSQGTSALTLLAPLSNLFCFAFSVSQSWSVFFRLIYLSHRCNNFRMCVTVSCPGGRLCSDFLILCIPILLSDLVPLLMLFLDLILPFLSQSSRWLHCIGDRTDLMTD